MNPCTQAAVNFDTPNGKLRERLFSSNTAPSFASKALNDFTPDLLKLHFHAARTNDWSLTEAGQHVIETHFIFPLFKLDPADPTNYCFAPSDAIIKNCLDEGREIYYRTGTSIEHTAGQHFNTVPPPDFDKYAEILAGIVRHYNHGWANGFHYGIKYWEIWNEAEAPNCWDGPVTEYYRLFITVYKRLKKEFPEIKVGGPVFWCLQEATYTPFLQACKNAGIAPDFISWHSYETKPERIIAEPARARALADSFGFTEAELHLTEWHFLTAWEGMHRNVTRRSYMHNMLDPDGMVGIDSAVFNLAALAGFHDTPLDAAFYYGASPDAIPWGFHDIYHGLNKNYYSMLMFGTILTQCPNRVKAESSAPNLSVLSGLSNDGKNGMILLSDFRGEEQVIRLKVEGMEQADVSVDVLDNGRDLLPEQPTWKNGLLTLVKKEPGSAAWLITFEKE